MKALFNTISSYLTDEIQRVCSVFLSINISIFSFWFLGHLDISMAATLGAIAAALSDHSNRISLRIKNMSIMLVFFTIVGITSQIFLQNYLIFIPLITIFTFVLVMFSALGERFSKIAFSSLLISVYIALIYRENTQIWYLDTLLILSGATCYSICSLIIFMMVPSRSTVESLSSFMQKIGDYINVRATFFDLDDSVSLQQKNKLLALKQDAVMSSWVNCREKLFSNLNKAHRNTKIQKMLMLFLNLQDLWEKVSASQDHLADFHHNLKHIDIIFRIRRLYETIGNECKHYAQILDNNQKYQMNGKIECYINSLDESLIFHKKNNNLNYEELGEVEQIVKNAKKIVALLQSLEEDVSDDLPIFTQVKLNSDNIEGFKNCYNAIKSHCNFQSSLFRHALRLSIVVFISSSLVPLFNLPMGYWILLTAILVCRPNYSATKVRLKLRIYGTVLGVIAGGVINMLALPTVIYLGLIVVANAIFFYFMERKYLLSVFFLTISVLISFDIMGISGANVMLPRIFDTIIGCIIAFLAVSFLWPDWNYINLRKNLNQTVQSSLEYFKHIIGQLQFGYQSNFSYRLARLNAYQNVTKLSQVIMQMQDEPKKYHHKLEIANELLTLNYSMLSYICALGAMRSGLKDIDDSDSFRAIFFPKAKELIPCLESSICGEDNNICHISNELKIILQTNNDLDSKEKSGLKQLFWLSELVVQFRDISRKLD